MKYQKSITPARLAIIIVIALTGCFKQGQKDVTGPAVASLTPNSLCAIYEKSPTRAKQRYTGKVIKVSGRIHRKETDVMSQVYVLLRAKSGRDVQCFFNKKWAKRLIKLEEGQKIVIKGRCTGRHIKVQMEGCVIVSTSP